MWNSTRILMISTLLSVLASASDPRSIPCDWRGSALAPAGLLRAVRRQGRAPKALALCHSQRGEFRPGARPVFGPDHDYQAGSQRCPTSRRCSVRCLSRTAHFDLAEGEAFEPPELSLSGFQVRNFMSSGIPERP